MAIYELDGQAPDLPATAPATKLRRPAKISAVLGSTDSDVRISRMDSDQNLAFASSTVVWNCSRRQPRIVRYITRTYTPKMTKSWLAGGVLSSASLKPIFMTSHFMKLVWKAFSYFQVTPKRSST